jgi:hypothetical protein
MAISLILLLSLSLYCFTFVIVDSASSSFDLNYRTAPLRKISPIGTLPQRTTSCIVEYSTSHYPDYFLFHAHIPKTGGTSFSRCFTKFWDKPRTEGVIQGFAAPNCRSWKPTANQSHIKYLSCEIYANGDLTYVSSTLHNSPHLKNLIMITMIRHPLNYIFSAFGHHASKRKEACQNFNAIINADQNPNSSSAACIHYDIRNLQTRALSSSDPQSFEPHTLGPANLTQAMSVLRNEMFFVGITRYFRASMCLLAYQMDQLHLHTSVCDCRQLGAANKIIRANKSSNSSLNHEDVLSADAAEVLHSQYINLDELLYNYALDIFLSRIFVAERHEKIKLLCADTDGETIMLRKQLMKH